MPRQNDSVGHAAARFAAELASPCIDFGDVVCDFAEEWCDYVEVATAQARASDCAHAQDILTDDEIEGRFEEIKGELPSAEARERFYRYQEAQTARLHILEEAAYRLGLAVGRRLALPVR